MSNTTGVYSDLRGYFDGSGDLYCEIDPRGFFIFVNNAWKNSLGYDPSEIIGKTFSDFLHPDDIARSVDAFNHDDHPDKNQYRNRYRHKNGKYRTFLWTGRFDPETNLMCSHARDVTEEIHRSSMLMAVAAIQESYMTKGRNRRDLFDQVLGEILKATDSHRGFIGDISENLLSGKKFLGVYAITPGFESENISALAATVIDSGAPAIINCTAEIPKSPNGEIPSVQSYFGMPLYYLDEFIGMFGVVDRHGGYDEEFVASLKPIVETTASVIGLYHTSMRENALRERFSVIVENLPILLTEYGPEGNLTWANRYFYEKTGLTESAMNSPDVLKKIVLSDSELKRATEFMLSGRVDWEDFNLKDTSGRVFPSAWTNVRLKNGRAIGIGQDLTDRRLVEQKMIQSSKMASLGEMSAGVSHEINNPLTIIQGSAFRAIQNLTGGKRDQVEDDLELIIQNCQRIASIVRGLRAFSRSVDHEPFVPTKIHNIIEDTLNLAQARFKSHGIGLQLEGDFETVIECRPVQLVQVLMNLLNNAFDAISEQRSGVRATWIAVEQMPENRIQISVEDSGVGIPHDLKNRVLEPFFTTKEIGKGTGLGLSISKGLIESHKGRLWLDVNSKRTRFVIELPIQQSSRS